MGSKGHTPSGLVFGSYSEARHRQTPQGTGQPPDQLLLLSSPRSIPTGLENWVWAEDMAFVPMAIPWSPEHQTQSLQVTRKQLETEEQAAFPLGGPSPRHLYLACKQNNKWGHPRGYRIQMISAPGEPLPRNSPLERAVSWGRWVRVHCWRGWLL